MSRKAPKTVHGEALTRRNPLHRVELSAPTREPVRSFTARQVWCPRCQARPGRRCTWTLAEAREKALDVVECGPDDPRRYFTSEHSGRSYRRATVQEHDRIVRRELRELAGRHHQERERRAAELTGLAAIDQGAPLLLLAVSQDRAPEPRTIARFDSLPLFARVTP